MTSTPAPWMCQAIPSTLPTRDGPGFQIIGPTDDGIDVRTIAYVGGPHAAGDARLIVHAPELLGALKELLQNITFEDEGDLSYAEFAVMLVRANRAIFKATGVTP